MIAPADLTSQEAKFYRTLSSSARRDFLATRSFVKVSQQVVDRVLPASQLPDRPAGFNVKYLLTGDPFDINNALADYLTTTHGGEGNLVPDMTAAQTLQPPDLSHEELSYFKTLGAIEARRFIVTRSYMRLCQQVLDQKLPAYRLPKVPPGARGAYLLPGENDVISKAVKASLLDLLQRNPNSADGLLR